MEFAFSPIGLVRSCFTDTFGIPRQPGLVPEAEGSIVLLPPFDRAEAVRGLEQFSHVWILFVFHRVEARTPRATVRPPRLGGNRRTGVFATRSGYRPNPIGMSVVELVRVAPGPVLRVRGLDLLDGTPVLDIKPYLPYADRIEGARGGFAEAPPAASVAVAFSPDAGASCRRYEAGRGVPLRSLIERLLSLDPRPAYTRGRGRSRHHGFRLMDLEVRWEVRDEGFRVVSVGPASSSAPALPPPGAALSFCYETARLADTAGPAGRKEATMPVQKILWPTDFSGSAAKALPYVTSLTRKYDAEIHVLYVIEDLTVHKWYGEFETDHVQKILQWENKTAAKRLESICQDHLEGCPLYVKHVAVGDPATEILRHIEEQKVDMVVMATRGEAGRFAFGSVTEKVVKHARVPVVTIPIDDPESPEVAGGQE